MAIIIAESWYEVGLIRLPVPYLLEAGGTRRIARASSHSPPDHGPVRILMSVSNGCDGADEPLSLLLRGIGTCSKETQVYRVLAALLRYRWC